MLQKSQKKQYDLFAVSPWKPIGSAFGPIYDLREMLIPRRLRFGHPFFLSLSDVDSIPPSLSTRVRKVVVPGCATQKEIRLNGSSETPLTEDQG